MIDVLFKCKKGFSGFLKAPFTNGSRCGLAICLLLFGTVHAKSLQIDLHAKSAILMNLDSGAVLFEKNANTPVFPASITKIATALFVLDIKRPDLAAMATVSAESVKVKSIKKNSSQMPPYWLEADGTRMGLVKDEQISIDSLLHGLMLASANDAANVLGETMSGSILAFVNELNQYLQALGCRNTHFLNPHGLHQDEHITTAYDICLIAKKAMANPTFCDIVAKVEYLKPATNKHSEEYLKQTNHLLRPGRFFYPKAIGIKTGYTSRAQNALVAAASHEGRNLVAVILGCEKRNHRYEDARALFETAFAEQKVHQTIFSGSESYSRTIDGATSPLQAVLNGEFAIDFYPSEEPENLKAQIFWKTPPLPIQKGAVVAEMRLMDAKGNLIHSAPLLAQTEVKGSFLFMLKNRWSRLFH